MCRSTRVFSAFLIVIGAVLFALLLVSCADILNPEVNGRWNPADPNYDAATDPDLAGVAPVVTITAVNTGSDTVLGWSWEADIADCTFRYAVNQNGNFEFSSEEYGATTTAETTGADGTWYCWVQAKSPAGVLSDTASATGVVDMSGPACVVSLVKPETGYYTGKSANISVQFSWTVDDASEVESYIVRVGNNEDLDSATVTESFVVTSGASYTANLSAATHGPYNGWWQVGAEDADGNVTWSAVRRIRIGITANDYDADGYADLIVGAPHYTTGMPDYLTVGKVKLYRRNELGAIVYVTEWEGLSANDYLGQCLNFVGDYDGDGRADFAVGDPENNRVFLHLSTKSGFPDTGALQIIGQTDGCLGSAMTGGDFNGDGYDDLAVGAAMYSGSRGNISLYFGNATGTAGTPIVSDPGALSWSRLGTSIVMADVNNDGYDDIIAGAPGENGSAPAGSVLIYFGGSPPDLYADLTLTMNEQSFFGYEVAADDINGDGYADIVVGAPGYNGAITDGGAVYVFKGGETGSIVSTPVFSYAPGASGSNLRVGYSVDCGDITGDGLADVLVGVPFYNNATDYWGAVYVYTSSGAGPSIQFDTAKLICTTALLGQTYAGQCVSVAGDLDGNGINDIAYVLPGSDVTNTDCGAVGIVFGAPNLGTSLTYDIRVDGIATNELLGGTNMTINTFEMGRTLGRR